MPDRFIKDDPTTRYNRVLSRAQTMPRGPASILPSGAGVMENYQAPAPPRDLSGVKRFVDRVGDFVTGSPERSEMLRRQSRSVGQVLSGVPAPTGQIPQGRSEDRITAEQQSNAQARENQPPRMPPTTEAPQRRFNFGGEQDIVNFNGTWTNVPKGTNATAETMAATNASLDARFGAGRQGVYSANTGRTVMLDDDRAQRTRDFAARRGLQQMSETSPEDRILAQREASAGRFRRGENLSGEMVGADGITYMRGSRMDGGTGIVGGGSSGGLYGNAAAEMIGTAQRIGQRRGLRRDAATAAEASKTAFDQQYKSGMLDVSEMNALANYANSQRQTPGKNQGVVKVNMGAVDLQGNALPDTMQLGNITIPLDDQGQQMLLSLRDEFVRTGRATSAEQAWQLAGEAYALGLGTELQQQQE